MSEEETKTTDETVSKRGPGRPRKDRNVIFYRAGNRIKAWNVALGINVNVSEKDLRGNVVIFDGLGFDYVNWCRNRTREGFYNAATRMPFRQTDGAIAQKELDRLEEDYRNNKTLRRVMDACSRLFDGDHADEPVILAGVFWMRLFANLFIREAGADGISRTHFERPTGKVWASVNLLSSQGPGYNYTLEAWNGVKNMVFPPVFCVRMDGSDAPDVADTGEPETWNPRELAAAILHGLWRTKSVDSCAALSEAPKSASGGVALASEAPSACIDEGEKAEATEANPDAEAVESVSPEAEPPPAVDQPAEPEVSTPPPAPRTWGEILETSVWLKGLTTAKELQAPMPLSRVLKMATDHAVTNTLTAECRKIGDKKLRNEYKRDNLHVWYAAPLFGDRFKGSVKDNVSGYTGLACLDFDGMTSFSTAEDTRDNIFMEFKEVLFCATSASGLGVYAIVALDFDGTEEGYRNALAGAFEMFESKGYMPDTGCADPTRARYLSSDPDALSRPDAYVPKAIKADGEGYSLLSAGMLRKAWTNGARKRKGAGKEYLTEALNRLGTAPDGTKDDTMTSVMGTVARLIRNYGLNADETYDRVRAMANEYGYDSRKTADKIRRLGVTNGEGK